MASPDTMDLVAFSPSHILIMRDAVQDEVGDLVDYVTAEDLEVGRYGVESGGYLRTLAGGEGRGLCTIPQASALQWRALADCMPFRWVIKKTANEYRPMPAFPYRVVWRMMARAGCETPDAWIHTGAFNLVRVHGRFKCGKASAPGIYRNLGAALGKLRSFSGIYGWRHWSRLVAFHKPEELVAKVVMPLRLSVQHAVIAGACPVCFGRKIVETHWCAGGDVNNGAVGFDDGPYYESPWALCPKCKPKLADLFPQPQARRTS